ncbi:MAG TPA: hypothetical protein ENI27_06220 [bacterium]|nr:hypothetical protein [bacterium]
MRKLGKLFLALALVMLIALPARAGVNDRFSDIELGDSGKSKNVIRLPQIPTPPGDPTSGYNWIYADENANIYTEDEDGNITALSKPIVYINSIDDLTFLTSGVSANPAAGQVPYSSDSGASFFWADWGKHYIIDPYAIARSGGTEFPVAGTTVISISGISAYFRSVLEEDDGKTITFEIADAGSPVGNTDNLSGDTPFSIWAPLNSGVSSYDGNGGNMISGITVEQGDSGVTHQPFRIGRVTTSTLSGGGDYNSVRILGDKATFKAQYNAGVSVVPVERYLETGNANPVDVVSPSFTTGQGFVIDENDGNVWLIDLSLGSSSAGDGDAIGKALAGATVYLPTVITKNMDGQPMTFIVAAPKATAGTTNMTLWAGATATSGVSIENATGVTNDALDADAEGDSITLMPSYDKQIYYYQGSRIQ